jgi:hypothetical protein
MFKKVYYIIIFNSYIGYACMFKDVWMYTYVYISGPRQYVYIFSENYRAASSRIYWGRGGHSLVYFNIRVACGHSSAPPADLIFVFYIFWESLKQMSVLCSNKRGVFQLAAGRMRGRVEGKRQPGIDGHHFLAVYTADVYMYIWGCMYVL